MHPKVGTEGEQFDRAYKLDVWEIRVVKSPEDVLVSFKSRQPDFTGTYDEVTAYWNTLGVATAYIPAYHRCRSGHCSEE